MRCAPYVRPSASPSILWSGIKGKSFTVAALADAGVKRISLATSLYKAAMTGLLNAAKEVREHGTFGYLDTSLATPDMNAFLRD
jgi:2-methylisocitrate lyase-like PEP mutase family enzyme